MKNGLIFDIKRYAIHDGKGIRTTVFFKSCPLRCQWCHNPESQKSKKEIMLFTDKCMKSCNLCVNICDKNAITKNGIISINQDLCNYCGLCEDDCPTEAIKIIGKNFEIDDLIKEIEKDTVLYDESSGGVSFSGGEPMSQINFLYEILKECKNRYISTLVDTSGYTEFENFLRINDFVDQYFFDIKIIDDGLHKKYTGVSNKLILENLKKLSDIHENIEVRLALIENITDNTENIDNIIKFLNDINLKKISLLNYHRGGVAKYNRLGLEYKLPNIKPLSAKKTNAIKDKFIKNGFIVKIGG